MKSMIHNFLRRLITITPSDSRDEYGDPLYGASYHVRARVQPHTTNAVGTDGNVPRAAYTMYFTAPYPISPRCRITLASTDPADPTYDLVATEVCNYYDDHDRYQYTRVVCA